MSNRVVLAVDGGNSKTDLALVREDGSLLAHARGPLSSPHHLGLDRSVALLQDLLDEALGSVGLDGSPRAAVAQVFLAGVDFPAEEDALHDVGAAGPVTNGLRHGSAVPAQPSSSSSSRPKRIPSTHSPSRQ